MLDDLVNAKRITKQQKEMYLTYTGTEHGHNTLNNMMHDTFMEEPHPSQFTGESFAYLDGRRSVLRDIQRTIKFVEAELKGLNHVEPKPKPKR